MHDYLALTPDNELKVNMMFKVHNLVLMRMKQKPARNAVKRAMFGKEVDADADKKDASTADGGRRTRRNKRNSRYYSKNRFM